MAWSSRWRNAKGRTTKFGDEAQVFWYSFDNGAEVLLIIASPTVYSAEACSRFVDVLTLRKFRLFHVFRRCAFRGSQQRARQRRHVRVARERPQGNDRRPGPRIDSPSVEFFIGAMRSLPHGVLQPCSLRLKLLCPPCDGRRRTCRRIAL